jgi:hypothetical protein
LEEQQQLVLEPSEQGPPVQLVSMPKVGLE